MAGNLTLRAAVVWKPRNDLGQFVARRIAPAAAAGAKAWADAVLARAQQIVPVDTGELRDSGHVVVVVEDKRCYARVQFDADHAAFVEYGTGRRGAASAGAGPHGYNQEWAGMAAQPYLRPASDEVKPEAKELVKQEVALALL